MAFLFAALFSAAAWADFWCLRDRFLAADVAVLVVRAVWLLSPRFMEVNWYIY